MTDPQILRALGYSTTRFNGHVEQEPDGMKAWYRYSNDFVMVNRTDYMGTYVWQVTSFDNRVWRLLPGKRSREGHLDGNDYKNTK